jgi:hypothetical protein
VIRIGAFEYVDAPRTGRSGGVRKSPNARPIATIVQDLLLRHTPSNRAKRSMHEGKWMAVRPRMKPASPRRDTRFSNCFDISPLAQSALGNFTDREFMDGISGVVHLEFSPLRFRNLEYGGTGWR